MRLTIICSGGRLRSRLASLLALPALHLCLFQQSTSLCFLSPNPPIFDLILLYQSLWRGTENTLIFAEFADPPVFVGWWVVKIAKCLLLTSLPGSNEILSASATSILLRATRGWCLLLPVRCMLRSSIFLVCLSVGRMCATRHVGTCLCCLGVHPGCWWVLIRIGVVKWPWNSSRNLRIEGESKLGRGARFLGSLLL